MSEIEKFYNAVSAKFGVQKKFSELTPMEVNILCQGVSMILQVVGTDMQEPKLIANIWRTPTGEILQSKYRHDFVQDSAGNFIDGGS